MTPSDVPTGIKLDLKSGVLEITWNDGHVSRYASAYLRQVCPCAQCRGHAPGEVEPPPLEAVADVRILHIRPVGSYAVRFDLSDGHETGIYSFAFLRENCPTGS